MTVIVVSWGCYSDYNVRGMQTGLEWYGGVTVIVVSWGCYSDHNVMGVQTVSRLIWGFDCGIMGVLQ